MRSDTSAKTILLSAGGTGGHLFPAESLAAELIRRGYVVELATDERADKYGRRFPARAIHIIASATLKGRSPSAILATGAALARGFVQSWRLMHRLKPAVVVGFGGYPTVPPLSAAVLAHVPTVLHEQNAVMGRANARLARRVTRIATSFAEVRMPAGLAGKVDFTGNPVRDMVIEAAALPYPDLEADGPFNLIVTGGSQGARYFSDAVPPAIALLDADLRARLRLTQQVRPEDMDRVKAAYAAIDVAAELSSFFVDLPARIAASHLVIGRAGASTVTELAIIGRPGLLVPLPGALDQDQAANARVLETVGGGWSHAQKDLTPEVLAAEISRLMRAPQMLIAAAVAARSVGRPDAVARLADVVERAAKGG
ncbi:MAG: undecaprenyldiphospho-muramoylpentapeptide beta-N-acetylglucosaminyltransferase [Ancalomicrobiaceae bacterium]|nr:undecaprenyldiphospho-muramoylpentapeptide beta-N-acetylglucosaminyltransferase [Ancalomicrobiaceae bacterium]